MTAPLGVDLDLQIAIVAALSASEDLQLLLGDDPNKWLQQDRKGGDFPFVSIGEAGQVDDSASCLTASEIYPVLHVWSRGNGWTEAKKIAAAITAALHNVTLTLSENECVLIEMSRTDPMRDPDGVTKHIALTFRALTNNNQ